MRNIRAIEFVDESFIARAQATRRFESNFIRTLFLSYTFIFDGINANFISIHVCCIMERHLNFIGVLSRVPCRSGARFYLKSLSIIECNAASVGDFMLNLCNAAPRIIILWKNNRAIMWKQRRRTRKCRYQLVFDFVR